jgi:hypothetical protein
VLLYSFVLYRVPEDGASAPKRVGIIFCVMYDIKIALRALVLWLLSVACKNKEQSL